MLFQPSSSRRLLAVGISLGFTSLLAACSSSSSTSSSTASAPVTITSADGKSHITVQSSAGTIVKASAQSTPAMVPGTDVYPLGFFGYSVTGLSAGASVQVTITLPEGTNANDYVKCNAAMTSCTALDASLVTASGNKLVLKLTDGGAGDEDGAADGTITDPGAPGVRLPSPTATYFLPFTSQTQGAEPGFYVVPSTDPTSARVNVSSGMIDVGSATYVEQALTDPAGNIYEMVPQTAFYASSDGVNDHVYKVDLSDISKAPSAVQLSNLSMYFSWSGGSPGPECNFGVAEQTANSPDSTIVLVQTAGVDNMCNTADDKVYALSSSNSMADEPAVTPIAAPQPVLNHLNSQFIPATAAPVFAASSGDLGGIVYIDSSGNLSFAADASFKNPKALLSGITAFNVVYSNPGNLFVVAGTATAASLYRIDESGTISADLYDFQSSSLPDVYNFRGYSYADAASGTLWFSDNGGTYTNNQETSYSVKLAQVPLSGQSEATVLYTATGSLPASFTGTTYVIRPKGISGSNLVFMQQSYREYTVDYYNNLVYTTGSDASIQALPLNASAQTTPTVIDSTQGYFSLAIMADGSIVETNLAIDGTGHASGETTSVIGIDGSTLRSYKNSALTGSYTQVRGTITQPALSAPIVYLAEGDASQSANLLNATVYAVTAGSLDQTALTQSDGSAFTLTSADETPSLYSDGVLILPDFQFTPSTFNFDFPGVLDVLNNRWISIPLTNSQATEFPPRAYEPSFEAKASLFF